MPSSKTFQWGNKTLHLKSAVAFCIEVPFLITGNQMYSIARRYGSWKSTIKKVDEAIFLQKHIALEIRRMGLENFGRGTTAYISETGFLAPEQYWLVSNRTSLRTIDLTNLYKLAEDAIVKGLKGHGISGLGMDDSRAIRQTQYKDFLDEGDETLKIVFYAQLYDLEG